METLTFIVVSIVAMGGFFAFMIAEAKRQTRLWYETAAANGLTATGKYPLLSATGKWAQGEVSFSHEVLGSGKSSVTYHTVTFTRPGLADQPVPAELARLGFGPKPEESQFFLRADGQLDGKKMRVMLAVIRDGRPPADA